MPEASGPPLLACGPKPCLLKSNPSRCHTKAASSFKTSLLDRAMTSSTMGVIQVNVFETSRDSREGDKELLVQVDACELFHFCLQQH